MRTEKEMLDLIIKTAKRDERIYGVQLRGSRVSPHTIRDSFQDYNLLFFVDDVDNFKQYPQWLNTFGDRIMQRRRDISGGGVVYELLCVDGVKIEIEILLSECFYINTEYIILFSRGTPKPNPADLPDEEKPGSVSEIGFKSRCDSFWWYTQHVAKGIARDELPFAQYYLSILRQELFQMIEWHAGNNALGMHRRFLKKNLEEKSYNLIKKSYANSDYRNIWNAMLTLCGLFRETAGKVAEVNGFIYPSGNDESMTAYLASLVEEIGLKPRKTAPSAVKANDANLRQEYMPYGTVLIVDDMETNLRVAKSLMEPYGLKIDIARSGIEAIEKITENRDYDMVFMDHLMPEMDGITAANAILDRGYTGPIVALTANSALGQENVFISTGFDAFLSKPIDGIKLNNLLNKYIRDKQSPIVLAEARSVMVKRADEKHRQRLQMVNEGLAAVFVRDAEKAIQALEKYDKNNLSNYVINAHAMKSSLKVMGEDGLSDLALRLEEAGRGGQMNVIEKETPDFIDALKKFMVKLSPDIR